MIDAFILVVCPISINFSDLIDIPRQNESLCGVTKLRNKIYVLSEDSTGLNNLIRVYEDRNPFRLLENIEINQLSSVFDIGSNEKDNCLYVADGRTHVWKITKGRNGQHKIIKWMTTDYMLYHCTLSVSSLGKLLVVCNFFSHMNIYGSDAESRSIQLPRGIKYPVHAVETSIGYFIILHEWMINEEDGQSGEGAREIETKWVVSKLTRDGKMVIRRFIPSNEVQQMVYPSYLVLD